jgi:hypothetical protein
MVVAGYPYPTISLVRGVCQSQIRLRRKGTPNQYPMERKSGGEVIRELVVYAKWEKQLQLSTLFNPLNLLTAHLSQQYHLLSLRKFGSLYSVEINSAGNSFA